MRADLVRAIIRNRTAVTGLAITALVVLAVTVGAALSPYSATDMDFLNLLAPPSPAHPFGTDSFGRDVLTRVLFGGRVSLLVSLAGVSTACIAGAVAGLYAAWHGGWVDAVLMRLSDLIFSFPSFVLALFLMVVLGSSVLNVAAAVALVYLPIFARLTRNMALLVKEEPYVQAARLMGQSTARILFAEILPNIGAPILVQASVGVAFAVVIEAGLSFLGLGIQPPAPSWGSIMSVGRQYVERAWWIVAFPGACLFLLVFSVNLFGDWLRDRLDPRSRSR